MSAIHDAPPTGCREEYEHDRDREIVGAMCPYIFSEGSTVYCNNSRDVLRSKTTAAYGRSRRNR